MTNEQMTSGFDYTKWINEGQSALALLQEKRNLLAKELEGIDEQLKVVKKKIGAKSDGPQRFRIKPLIIKFLEGKKTSKVEELVASIMKGREGCTKEQIEGALKRFENEMDNVSIKDGIITVKVEE
jgi:hypothetical protein